MAGMGGGGMGQPRQLMPAGSPGQMGGIGGNPGLPAGGGTGNMMGMLPGIMQMMQGGNMNPMISQMLMQALSGGFGGAKPMNPTVPPGGPVARANDPVAPTGRPVQNDIYNPMPQQPPAATRPGFTTPGVAPLPPRTPIQNNPVALPPRMQQPSPLVPPTPGGRPAPRPIAPPPGNSAPGSNANAAEIFQLQQKLQNSQQNAPIENLRYQRRLRELGVN